MVTSKGKSSRSKANDSIKKEKLIISIDQTRDNDPVKAIKTQNQREIEQLSAVANIINQEHERQKSIQNSARVA